jgi:hypothetical protein
VLCFLSVIGPCHEPRAPQGFQVSESPENYSLGTIIVKRQISRSIHAVTKGHVPMTDNDLQTLRRKLTAAHTPGAYRAAYEIFIRPTSRTQKEIAEIIDRETAAPEMLEALEMAVIALRHPESVSTMSAVVHMAEAAIQKARGGQ